MGQRSIKDMFAGSSKPIEADASEGTHTRVAELPDADVGEEGDGEASIGDAPSNVLLRRVAARLLDRRPISR